MMSDAGPIAHTVEVYLGDYIDRGPHSRTVIDLLAVRLVANHAICLRGNHEAVMEGFFQDPAILRLLAAIGRHADARILWHRAAQRNRDRPRSASRFLGVFPRAHELFMQCLRYQFSCGDFLFVHAGIRPGIPIDQQNPNDLIWIRDEFLNSAQDHGHFIVHGHTPVPHADIRHNRINIDTGAWRTGTLTCIAIEGSTILFL